MQGRVMRSGAKVDHTLSNFNAEFDVVVPGCGYAGGISAVEAADRSRMEQKDKEGSVHMVSNIEIDPQEQSDREFGVIAAFFVGEYRHTEPSWCSGR